METKVILLAEDNPTDQTLTVHAFRQHGVANDIVIANDGVEALDYLFGTGAHAGRDTSRLPALMLLDLKMPRLDGLETLRRLRADERTKLLPVVILTSSSEERDLLSGYRLGCNSYIVKPVDFAQFAESVRLLKLYWLVLNEGPPANYRP